MKIKQIGVLVCCLLLTIAISSCKRDHFKVYAVQGAEYKEIEVRLKDQFDTEPKTVKLYTLAYFANPVSKNEGKINNPDVHLAWYKLEDTPLIKRRVKFSNQFGDQEWILGKPRFLLVPGEKKEEGSTKPGEFNHFKCYEVLEGDFSKREVTLKDQFDQSPVKVVVEGPKFFCNPVQKNSEEIDNESYHLACYKISLSGGTTSLPRTVEIENQFGRNRFDVVKIVMLCVPSDKENFEVVE